MIRFLVPASLVLAVLIAAPHRADADCASGFLAPGSLVCVTTGSFASSSATVTTSSDGTIKWDVYLTTSVGSTLLHQEKSLGFTASYSAGFGEYSVCGDRTSNHTMGTNYSLCISSP